MIWFSTIICLISAIYHFSVNGYRLNSVGGVISLVWGCVLLVNAISPFEWYPISDDCNTVLLIGTMSICVGLFTGKRNTLSGNYYTNDEHVNENKTKVFFVIQFIIILIMIPMVIKALQIILNNNLNLYILRDLYATGGESGSYMTTFERLFYIHYIVGPMSTACILIDAILFFKNNMWKKPLIYLSVMAIFISIYSAARTTFFYAIIVMLICYIQFSNRHKRIDLVRIKRRIKYFVFAFVILMVFITMFRDNTDSRGISYIVKTLVQYFCGGTRILNQAMNSPVKYGLDVYSYGYCTIGGFLAILSLVNTYIFGKLGLNLLPLNFNALMHVQDYMNSNIKYGPVSQMNAFPTMFYYFLRDGGVVYLVIIVFLFMKVLTRYERKCLLNPSIKSTFVYCYLFYVAIMTVCWWEPIRTEFWMALFWGLMLCKYVLESRIMIKISFGKI